MKFLSRAKTCLKFSFFNFFFIAKGRKKITTYEFVLFLPLIPATEWYDMFLWFNTNKTNIKVPRRWNCEKGMEFLRFMAFDGGSLILIKFTYMFSISIARWPDSGYLWDFEQKGLDFKATNKEEMFA